MRSKLAGLAIAAGTALLLAAGGSAGTASKNAALVIHHQTRGCHAWSLDGGSYQVRQVVHLLKGGSLTVTDNDVMSHQLLKTSGPAVKITLLTSGAANTGKLKPPYALGLMPHMGASVRVTFSRPGTYTLTTKEGNDYYPGIKTVGPDNILRATVIVSA